MGLKKKKNIIILTLCMVVCFTLYQLYFFLTISSETGRTKIIPVFEHDTNELIHLRTMSDVFINDNGILRGVFYSYMPKYRPDALNEFMCLKSKQKIPFDNVNDDYCDCEDGSDEPSTSACVNGTFYCDSQYHSKPVSMHSVPSGKVNDGICDCCDGSDEFLIIGQKVLSQSNDRHYRYYVPKCPNIC